MNKYVKGPEDYQNYYHVDPVLGLIWLDGKNQPVPKEHPLTNQITNSISPSDIGTADQHDVSAIKKDVKVLIKIK